MKKYAFTVKELVELIDSGVVSELSTDTEKILSIERHFMHEGREPIKDESFYI